MSKFLSCLVFFSICLVGFSATANPPKAYNEILDQDGELRAPYAEYQQKFGVQIYPVDDHKVNTLLDKPLNDKIKILPIPLVISSAEYQLIQIGAQQRMEALMAFFIDVVINNSEKIKAAKMLDDEVIEAIFSLEEGTNLKLLRDIWSGRKKEDINAAYGPDIVRNSDGEFVVIEDNIGAIGGVGDIAATHNIMGQVDGRNTNYQAPLANAILAFLAETPKEKWDEEVLAIVAYSKSNKGSISPSDNEDQRQAAVLKKLRIKTVSINELSKDEEMLQKVFYGNKIKKIINLCEPYYLGDNHIQKFLWISLFKKQQVKFFFSPGLSILSTKVLLPFVDDFIRLYLNQEPILKTQPTEWITANAMLLDETMDESWVVKKTDGAQGEGVFVVKDLTQSGKKALRNLIGEGLSLMALKQGMMLPLFVRQKLVDPSYIPATIPDSWVKFNVDYRPHTFVINGMPQMPAIWGRASSKLPGILNNVSQGAMELVIKTPTGACEDSLMSDDTTAPVPAAR